ncbi:MAG: YlxR family protein [Vampirovibrionia bacterium]
MILERQCVSCRLKLPKADLIQIMFATETKKLHLQPSTKLNGRSAYICYKKSCIEQSLKKGKLQKALRKKISSEITEMLQNIAK